MTRHRMPTWRGGAFCLPHLRLVLGHVHRQLHELPDRALGLSLPGNGTTLATHSDREQLFKRAGRLVVDLCKRYYEKDDSSIPPRSMGFKAFENAMTLDIAMGGSTNTILHILAIAQEASDRLHHGRH